MISVTSAQPQDARALAELAEEMDRFYGATEFEPIEVRVGQINEALFSVPPAAHAILAWDGGKSLIGFASYSFLWPAVGLTRSLYLKELYVIAAARRAGTGKLLMRHLHGIAVESRCSRVEWTTDLENLGAQGFYADLGVAVDKSKLSYRVQGDDLERHAAGTA